MGKHADLSFLWIDYKKSILTVTSLLSFISCIVILWQILMVLQKHLCLWNGSLVKRCILTGQATSRNCYWIQQLANFGKFTFLQLHLVFSSLVYAEIFPDEKLPHFITGTVHALSYYGAVPKYLVPDNLRTAVTRHSKDELVLQSAFSDLETFYDTIILPPPPRKPKGKPTVEKSCAFLGDASGRRIKERYLYLSGSSKCCGQKKSQQTSTSVLSRKNLTFGNPA